jgi:methylated-DNA-[protein]-cysteine S-methyltransferase
MEQGVNMPESLLLLLNRLSTPIGEMLIVADCEGDLRAVDWADHEPRMRLLLKRHYGEKGYTLEESSKSNETIRAITRYFEGDLPAIDSLPVKTAGTAFQHMVWDALRDIPCGMTMSYAQLATQIGRPAAVRAVGLANGANPVGVIVPCHRVIGANGSLTGYGGGLHRKAWLLNHEGCVTGDRAQSDAQQETLF